MKNASQAYEMNKSCPQQNSDTVPSVYEANALTIALLELMYVEHLKLDRVLPECY